MFISSDGWKHVEFLFSGATVVALVAHAVNTFPTPGNVYGQWLLGVIKFAVGQRQGALNAFQGNDTVVAARSSGDWIRDRQRHGNGQQAYRGHAYLSYERHREGNEDRDHHPHGSQVGYLGAFHGLRVSPSITTPFWQ